MDNFKNLAKATVSTGYTSTDTSIVLSTGHGAKLPTAPFNVVWWNSTDYPDPADDPNVEIVRVTAVSTDTLTVTRGQESITATSKNTVGKTYKMVAALTAKTLNTEIVSGSGTGAGSVILGDGGSHTLTLTTQTMSADAVIVFPSAPGSTGILLGTVSGSTITLSQVGMTGTGNVVRDTSPTLVTPNIGVATATTVNKVTITAPATSATFTLANGKTFVVNNSVTLSGTDSTVITLPAATASLISTAAAEINALTSKATPVSGDLLIIEDSAASNAKKKITIGSLPAGGGGSGIDPSDPTQAILVEEFGIGAHGLDGQTGALGWMVSTIGGGVAIDQGAGEQGHPGVHTLTTAAVAAGDGGFISLGDSATISSTRIPFKNMAADANWTLYWIFKINSTATIRFRCGVVAAGTGATIAPANWMGLRYDTNATFADTQFKFATVASSTASTANLGAVSTGWHKFRMRSTSAGTILGLLDAGTEQSLATNVPTNDMTPFISIQTDTTAARIASADFFSYKITGLTR